MNTKVLSDSSVNFLSVNVSPWLRMLALSVSITLLVTMLVPPITLPQAGTVISGTVFDARERRPLGGVRLIVVQATSEIRLPLEQMPFAAVTDPEGQFAVRVAGMSRYLIVPVKDGYVYPRRHADPGQIGSWVDIGNNDTVGIQVAMLPEMSIAGRVYYPDGSPAIGIPVFVLEYTYDDVGRRKLLPVPFNARRTDDRGEYRFFGLNAGEYYVRANTGSAVGRWPGVFYPGTIDERRAGPVSGKPGDRVRLEHLILVERETTKVTLRFPPSDMIGLRQPERSVHFVDGESLAAFGGRQDLVLELARGTHEVNLDWGLRGQQQSYASNLMLNATGGEVVTQVQPSTLFRVSVDAVLGNASPAPAPILSQLKCSLRSTVQSIPLDCKGNTDVPAGLYDFRVEGLPTDAYVASAKTGERNFLSGPLEVGSDIRVAVHIEMRGASLFGLVQDKAGSRLSHGTVVLVPTDPSLRGVTLRYRRATSDIFGNFELRGIAPGSYRLFAWRDIDGQAYLNSEFIRPFEGGATEVLLEREESLSLTITALEKEQIVP